MKVQLAKVDLLLRDIQDCQHHCNVTIINCLV